MTIEGGYLIVARKLWESKVAAMPPHYREIWLWLLKEANHKTVNCNGQIIERGQCIRSYTDIIEGLSWYVGYRKQSYKKHHCEKAMMYLTKERMVTTTKTTRGLIITICNYDYYQNHKNYESDNESDNKDTMERQWSDTINNECNECNECKNTTASDTQKSIKDENLDRESKPTSPQEVKTATDNSSGIPETSGAEAKGRQTRNKSTNPEIKQFIDFAYQEYKKKYGKPLIIESGRDPALVKRLLKDFSLDELKELYLKFLNSDDSFINDAGRGINIFFPTINKLVSGCRDIKDIQEEKVKRELEESKRRMAAKGYEV